VRSVALSVTYNESNSAGYSGAVYPDTPDTVCGEYVSQTAMSDCAADEYCTLPGCRVHLTQTSASPPPTMQITELVYSGTCSGTPTSTITTESGVCVPSTEAYRRLWWGNGTDSYSPTDPRTAYVGFKMVGDLVSYCWGTTQYTCESGFAAAPFAPGYLETTTVYCEPYGRYSSELTCETDTDGYCGTRTAGTLSRSPTHCHLHRLHLRPRLHPRRHHHTRRSPFMRASL